MTSKLSWITFVPFSLAAIAIKIIQVFYLTGEGATLYGLTSFQLSYIAIGLVVLVLLFSILFAIIDRKTAPYYKVSRNIFAGIFAIILALVLACDGANSLFNIFELSNFEILPIVDSVFTLLSAVVFVVIGLSNFASPKNTKGLSVFFLIPAVWAALRLVSCFLKLVTVSILSTDVTCLATYIFLTLFLFNYAVLISYIKGKSPVKMTLIYGFPAASICLAYATYLISNMLMSSVTIDLFSNLEAFEIALFGLFIFVLLIEITVRAKKKDEINVEDFDDEEKDDEKEEVKEEVKEKPKYQTVVDEDDDETIIITGVEDEYQANVPTHSYLETQDTSDFLYRRGPTSDEMNKDKSNYFDKENEDVDDYLTMEDKSYGAEEKEEVVPQNVYERRMDDIDKLILEISEDKEKR